MKKKNGASIRNKYGYLECKECGSIFIDVIDDQIWICRKCKSRGDLRDLKKWMQENPDKLYRD